MRNKLLVALFTIASLALVAQIVTLIVTVGPKQVTIHKLPPSTINFTLASASAASGVVSADISISTTRRPPVSVQFDVAYTSTDVSTLSVVASPAAIAAGKSITCNTTAPGVLRCIVAGININPLPSGVVATINATLINDTTVHLQNLLSVNAEANALTSTLTPGGGVLTSPIVVASLSCTAPGYENAGLPAGTYNLEPGESISCTATISKNAPAGGFTTPIPPVTGLTLPANIVVPAGSATAPFTITAQ